MVDVKRFDARAQRQKGAADLALAVRDDAQASLCSDEMRLTEGSQSGEWLGRTLVWKNKFCFEERKILPFDTASAMSLAQIPRCDRLGVSTTNKHDGLAEWSVHNAERAGANRIRWMHTCCMRCFTCSERNMALARATAAVANTFSLEIFQLRCRMWPDVDTSCARSLLESSSVTMQGSLRGLDDKAYSKQ
jgi:hypothetical protein